MESSTKLKDLIDSPRAAKALERAGFKTVADLEKVALTELASLNGVGERTLEQIQGLSKKEEPENYGEPEEGEHDIHLISPRENYVIWVLRGDKIIDPMRGGSRVFPPVLIQFKRGRGKISRNTYLMRKYFRDENKIREHIEAGKPWRKECVAWLRSRTKHGLEYTVMTD